MGLCSEPCFACWFGFTWRVSECSSRWRQGVLVSCSTCPCKSIWIEKGKWELSFFSHSASKLLDEIFFFFYSLGILHLHTLLESSSLTCTLRRCFTLGIFDYVMRLKSIFCFNNIVLFSNPIFFMHWGDSSCKLCFASIWHWKYSWLFLFHLKNHTVVICLWCKYQPNHMTRLMHQDAWHRHGPRPIWILASERETHLSYLQLKRGWGGGGWYLDEDVTCWHPTFHFALFAMFFEGGPRAEHLCNANSYFQRTLYIKFTLAAGWLGG